jgi:hypothetical protein
VATVLSRLASTSIGPFSWPVASACRFSSSIAFRTGWVVAAREGVVELLQRLDLGDGDVVESGRGGVEREGGHRQRDEHGGGGDGREDRAPEDAVQDRIPEAALAVLAPEPVQEGQASLLDPIAELPEQRGQHGQ